MRYAGLTDLFRRWPVYTPRGIRKLIASRDFPAPVHTINAGRTKVWYLPDIERYERAHPELTSEQAKRRKVAGYAIALARKRRQPTQEEAAV